MWQDVKHTADCYGLLNWVLFKFEGKCRLEHVSVNERITLIWKMWNNIRRYAHVMLLKRKLSKHDRFGDFLKTPQYFPPVFFTVPLTCIYPVWTALLMSQIATGTVLYTVEPVVTQQTD